MRQARVRFTYRDYLLLPEDKRYEILDGELCVVAAPDTTHQRVSRRIEMALIKHVEEHDLGEVLHAPYDVLLSDENVVQPDVLFVKKERMHIIGDKNIGGAPDLVIEIISEASREKDLEVKRKIYARFGVREYWTVDPRALTIEVLAWNEDGYLSVGKYRRAERVSSPLLPQLDLSVSQILG